MTLEQKLAKRASEKKSNDRWHNIGATIFSLIMVLVFGTKCLAELFAINGSVVGVENIQVAIAKQCWVWFIGTVIFGYNFNSAYKKLKGSF